MRRRFVCIVGGGVVDGLFDSMDLEARVRFGGRFGVSAAVAAAAAAAELIRGTSFLSDGFDEATLLLADDDSDEDDDNNGVLLWALVVLLDVDNGVFEALAVMALLLLVLLLLVDAAVAVSALWAAPGVATPLFGMLPDRDETDDAVVADGFGVEARVPTDDRMCVVEVRDAGGCGVAVRAEGEK